MLVERRAPRDLAATTSWVRTEHEDGAEQAVRYLHSLSHERVGLFARGDTPTSHAVQDDWPRAVRAPGLPADLPALAGADIPGWPRWNRQGIAQLADTLRAGRVSALLCHSDGDALALLQYGLTEVPGTFSLVAYDDEFSGFTSPPLTAVSPPKAYVGRLAVRMIMDLLGGPHVPPSHVEVQPQLILRASCGTFMACCEVRLRSSGVVLRFVL